MADSTKPNLSLIPSLAGTTLLSARRSGQTRDERLPLSLLVTGLQVAGALELSVAGLSGVLAAPQPPIIGAGAAQAVAGNDARLTDARTPSAHAASHQGGSDALAVDAAVGTGSFRTLGTGATQACAGNDSRLTNSRTPTAHAASHQGGSDSLSLDTLGAPTDITTLNVSTTAHGLAPKLPNDVTKYLDGTGAYSVPAGGGASKALSNLASVAINATLATGAGVQFAGVTTAAVAAASSAAGVGLALTADAAVAGTTNAGAAQGGDMTLTAGAAARLTSGNARGGAIYLIPGAGIGTGSAGGFGLWGTTSSFPGFKQRAGSAQLQITDATWAGRQTLWTGAIGIGPTMDSFGSNDAFLTQTGNSGSSVRLSSGNALGWTSGGDASQSPDTQLSRKGLLVVSFDSATRGDAGAWFNYAGTSRAAADVTNATATMAAITGLSAPLQAGQVYFVTMVIKGLNSTATEGLQFDFNGGTATMTDFWMGAGILASGGTDVIGTNISTSLAGVINFTTFTGESVIVFEGYLKCNAAGTLIPRFAENTSAVGTATVRKGSQMLLTNAP